MQITQDFAASLSDTKLCDRFGRIKALVSIWTAAEEVLKEEFQRRFGSKAKVEGDLFGATIFERSNSAISAERVIAALKKRGFSPKRIENFLAEVVKPSSSVIVLATPRQRHDSVSFAAASQPTAEKIAA